jgi:hypothetical protein
MFKVLLQIIILLILSLFVPSVLGKNPKICYYNLLIVAGVPLSLDTLNKYNDSDQYLIQVSPVVTQDIFSR